MYVQHRKMAQGRQVAVFLMFLGVAAYSAHAQIQISTLEELQAIGSKAEYPLDGHYVLTKDIDASVTKEWNDGKGFDPIGCQVDDPFTGIFDGQGHVIRDIFMSDGCCLGLFERVTEGGEIRNVCLEGGTISGSVIIGSIVAILEDGKVINCCASASVSGSSAVGGLIGETQVNTDAVIIDCYATGDVVGGDTTGGLIGCHDGNEVIRCYASGNVSGEHKVGGLIGSSRGFVAQCYATGTVKGELSVGGLIGVSGHRIENCYATGSVSGHWGIGGLFGGSTAPSAFACYAAGAVYSDDNKAGGLMEWHNYSYDSMWLHNYARQNFCMAPSFWDTDATGLTVSARKIGTGLPTAQMMSRETYESAGWDFKKVWGIREGVSYPYLLWQTGERIYLAEEASEENAEDEKKADAATIEPEQFTEHLNRSVPKEPVSSSDREPDDKLEESISGQVSINNGEEYAPQEEQQNTPPETDGCRGCDEGCMGSKSPVQRFKRVLTDWLLTGVAILTLMAISKMNRQ